MHIPMRFKCQTHRWKERPTEHRRVHTGQLRQEVMTENREDGVGGTNSPAPSLHWELAAPLTAPCSSSAHRGDSV